MIANDFDRSPSGARLLVAADEGGRRRPSTAAGAPSALLVLDADLRVLAANPFLPDGSGILPEGTVGRLLQDVLPADGLDMLAREVLAAGRARCNLFLSLEGDQAPRSLRVAITAIENGEAYREEARLLLTIEDLTEFEGLQASEERFRAMIESGWDGISLLSADATILYTTPATSRILGYAPDELVGRTAPELAHPEDAAAATAVFSRLAEAPHASITGQYRVRHKDGSWRWLEITCTNLLADPSVRAIVANLRDVTERKQAEEALRASNQTLQALIQASPVAIIVVDRERNIKLWSPAAERIFGWTEAEVMGRPFPFGGEDGGDEFQVNLKRTLQGRGTSGIETCRRRKDGSPIHLSFWGAPLHDRHGEITDYVAVVADISERKHAEKALRAQTEQLRSIADAMAAFVRTRDPREAYSLLLRDALRQTESEYGVAGIVVDGPVLRVLAHEGMVRDPAMDGELYEKALETQRERGYMEFPCSQYPFGHVISSGKAVISNDPVTDTRVQTPPASHRSVQAFLGVPVLCGTELIGMIGVANRPGGYTAAEQTKLEILAQMAGVLYDSYRRQEREASLEEQLRQSQKMEAVGRLAGGVAHDFNNMLAAITGYSDLLLHRMDAEDPLRAWLHEILKASERAAGLTRQLLVFSRKQVVTPQVLDLSEIVAGTHKMLRRLIGEDIELVTVPNPAAGWVKADPGQIEQVLLNLAINARDAMPEGGKVTIEIKNEELGGLPPDADALPPVSRPLLAPNPGSYVLLAVSDTGCGMDAEIQSHIFEPFFTTKEPGKGTGLGLATVYAIMQQTEGHVAVDSQPGRGTTFRIYLPRVEAAVQTAWAPDVPAASFAGSETVLLVEDEPMVRSLVREILRMNGYTVIEAMQGDEALRLCRQHEGEIDLLVTDLVMPGMSGRELVEQAAPLRPEMKVLLMSGYTDDAVVRHGIADAEVAFLQKPFTPAVFAAKVRDVLGAR